MRHSASASASGEFRMFVPALLIENVEPADASPCARRAHGRTLSSVTSVAPNSALPPALRSFERGLGFRGVAAREHDRRAGGGKPFRHAEPDAAIAAGDDCDAAGEIEQVHFSPKIATTNDPCGLLVALAL